MTSKETKRKREKDFREEFSAEKSLILHNDDVHSFDYVISALIDICNHEFEQAAQCTIITHYKGKCDVKKGGMELLKPLRQALAERELTATID